MFHNLKETLKKHPSIFYLIELRKRWLYQHYAKVYDDKTFITRLYQKANHGRVPDLENPKLFTEKLQWLKLYYRNPVIPICSDKIEAKKYIAEHGFPELVIPTIKTYSNANEINVSELPDKFILKASHGSGWNIICRGNKNNIDWINAKKTMNIWLSENLYILGREWNYKEQIPRLLVEELLDDDCVVDYKFMCFNGKVKAMQVNHEINGSKFVDFYDGNWKRIPDMGTGVCPVSNVDLPKPSQFDEMKSIAEQLSTPFPFVRVDLYNVRQKTYFGEMTFFPGSGFWSITPPQYDAILGDWLTLPDNK